MQRLVKQFERESLFVSSTDSDNPYHPALLPLYKHFSTVLYSICSPFTHDPHELAYISAARWPGFVQPVLDEHKHNKWLDAETQMNLDDNEVLKPPTEDVRMRLMRLFTPSMTAALETLYPRLTNASAWARANVPEQSLLTLPFEKSSPSKARPPQTKTTASSGDVLPRMSKFILVAAFLASTNPAKSDLRMFGRGLDERKKKRKGYGPRKGSGNSTAKVRSSASRYLRLISCLTEFYRSPSGCLVQLPSRLTDLLRSLAHYSKIMMSIHGLTHHSLRFQGSTRTWR